jgi:hypothetical protein
MSATAGHDSSPAYSHLINSNVQQEQVLSKFDSSFSPWGDYVFGSIMLVIGKLILIK